MINKVLCLFIGILINFLPNTIYAQEKIKIEGVLAVVGDKVILDSDIDKTFKEMNSQGISTSGISRCEILEKLMEDKLYAHHAIQDSIEVSDAEIYSYVDQNIEYFKENLGSLEEVLKFYGKTNKFSLREDLFQLNKEQQLSQKKQFEIVENIDVTPEEVRSFFAKIDSVDLPVFGTEVEIAQIVVEPKVSKEETKRIVDKLNDLKSDVEENGMSFKSKAILYSQDPGSRASGGKYTLHRKRPRMVKEFRDAAFSMQKGEISEPFSTDFGWHILMVENIKGQQVDVRHILLIPNVDPENLKESRKGLDTLRKRILDKEISFKDAAFNFSSDKNTRLNGGVLINPATNETRFELTKMDPKLYNQIKGLKEGEISKPILETSPSGGKKYKIIKLNKRFDEHEADYSQDYIKIKNLAMKDKQLKTIEKWVSDKIKDTHIYLNRSNKDCNFKNDWFKTKNQ